MTLLLFFLAGFAILAMGVTTDNLVAQVIGIALMALAVFEKIKQHRRGE